MGAIAIAQNVTASALQAQLLAERQARLQNVLLTMEEGVVVQAADGRVSDVNPAAESILGLSRDELMGRTSADPRWQAVHPDGSPWPGDEHPGMLALRTGQPQRAQIMGVDVPGHGRRWISINASPIKTSASSVPTGVVATFVDVTAQLATAARLAQSAADVADLYDNAPCGYYSLGPDRRFLRINARLLSWLGRTREEVVGKMGPTDFMVPGVLPMGAAAFRHLMDAGEVNDVQCELLPVGGKIRHVSISATAIFDAQGRFLQSRSVMYDVTDLILERERAARLAREQHAMLENEQLGIVKLKDGRFSWCNRAMQNIFGYEPGELLGQPGQMLHIDEQSGNALRAAANHVLGAGRPYRAQLQMRRKDGEPIWIDLSGVALSIQAYESLWMLLDITALKQAEEQRVKATRLEAENEHIRDLLAERGEMLELLAHEVRQPLNNAAAALAAASAAMGPSVSPEIAAPLARPEVLLGRVQASIDNALAASSLLVRGGRLQRADIDIDALIRVAIEDMAAADAKRIVVERATSTRTAAMDPSLMRLALRNLLSNALKFSPSETQVIVRIADSDDPLALVVDVVDAGGGIEPDLWPRLFDKGGRRGQGASTRTYGLGLYIVRRVMEMHGGSARLEHTHSQGTTMRLVINQPSDE